MCAPLALDGKPGVDLDAEGRGLLGQPAGEKREGDDVAAVGVERRCQGERAAEEGREIAPPPLGQRFRMIGLWGRFGVDGKSPDV